MVVCSSRAQLSQFSLLHTPYIYYIIGAIKSANAGVPASGYAESGAKLHKISESPYISCFFSLKSFVLSGLGADNTILEHGFMGLMGDLGGMGVNNAELSFFSSEQNKNSSTLFKISSEIKKLAPNYLRLFRRLFFILQKYCIIPMNKGRIAVENYMVPKPNSEINKNNSEIIKYSSDVF